MKPLQQINDAHCCNSKNFILMSCFLFKFPRGLQEDSVKKTETNTEHLSDWIKESSTFQSNFHASGLNQCQARVQFTLRLNWTFQRNQKFHV